MSAPHTTGTMPALPDLLPADADAAQDTLTPLQPVTPIAPGTLVPVPDLPKLLLRSLRAGCWLLNYRINGSPADTRYDGTLRVEAHSAGRTASGDLYQRPRVRVRVTLPKEEWIEVPRPGKPPLIRKYRYEYVLAAPPNPAAGIPIFARGQYRWYLRVTKLLEGFTRGSGFSLGFEMVRFTAPNTWTSEGSFTAQMGWTAPPAGFPSAADYLEGDVKSASGTVVGRLSMGWVSAYLRRATLEIDRVSVSELPLANAAGRGWKQVFDEVGWDLGVICSDSNVAEPSGVSWSDAEAHAAMLARRDSANLDREWRYHILAVRRLDSTERGIMYDDGAADSNNVPREGVAISSHWMIPNTAAWGQVRGLRFGTATDAYFRTAVHECGHAFGLYHNTVDMGFMNTTDVISAGATASQPFPTNIKWQYANDDLKRLRHYPDPFVRPGGVPFGDASNTSPPITPTDRAETVTDLELRVAAVLESLPLGAPVRVDLDLVNIGDDLATAPASLNFKSGNVAGRVTGPDGVAREFRSLLHCVESENTTLLEPGERVRNSLTLLRGPQGPLFPSPGAYEIEVEASWPDGGLEARVAGHTHVMVTPAVDAAHASAALKLMVTPDALLALALGGDHLDEGNAAIQGALDNAVLRPHYAYVGARRAGSRFMQRAADLPKARAMLTGKPVMSRAEREKADTLFGPGAKGGGNKVEGKKVVNKKAPKAKARK